MTSNFLIQNHGELGQQFQAYGSFRPVADPYVPFTGNQVPLANQVKLDSLFIMDVNVMDGTMMAPSTLFTKIWRMKNNGNVVWPVGTHLVWTDGDDFSSALSVDLDVCYLAFHFFLLPILTHMLLLIKVVSLHFRFHQLGCQLRVK